MSEFSIVAWLIVGLIGYAVYKIFSGKGGAVMFCKNCGHTGKTVSNTPGNIAIEIVLWLCFIVPGLVYSIWRISNKKATCGKCSSKELVPTDSPVALANKKQLNA